MTNTVTQPNSTDIPLALSVALPKETWSLQVMFLMALSWFHLRTRSVSLATCWSNRHNTTYCMHCSLWQEQDCLQQEWKCKCWCTIICVLYVLNSSWNANQWLLFCLYQINKLQSCRWFQWNQFNYTDHTKRLSVNKLAIFQNLSQISVLIKCTHSPWTQAV